MKMFGVFSFQSVAISRDQNGYLCYRVEAMLKDAATRHSAVEQGGAIHATERAILAVFESWRRRYYPRWPKCRLHTRIIDENGLKVIQATASTSRGRFKTIRQSQPLPTVDPRQVGDVVYQAVSSLYEEVWTTEQIPKPTRAELALAV